MYCGGEAKYDKIDGFDYVICDECGASTFGFNKEEAFYEWNSRVQIDDDESNYPVFPDSSKVNQPVQVLEVVENGNCEYLELWDYIKFCRNASATNIKQIHDRARDLIAKHKKCCKKSCKEENATCKKNLQLTRSDIEKILKPIEEIPLFNKYINRRDLTESDCFSLDELKPIFKHWIVNLICSALKIEE